MKYFVITLFLTLSAFAAIMYSSCTKDACNGTICLNKGVCKGGRCVCVDPVGIAGNNCETVYRKLYEGRYAGVAHGNAGHPDTTNVFDFVAGLDTTEYRTMKIEWRELGTPGLVTFAAQLNDITASGSTFAIAKTTVNSRIYEGYGTINKVSATIFLNETVMTPTDTTTNQLSFSNFVKQP